VPTTFSPQMRPSLSTSLTVLLSLLSGCTCSPASPVPITMRVVNSGNDPLYVDFTQGRLGLTVQRDVSGTLYPFDDLVCPCTACSAVCDPSCACPDAGAALVRRIAPGGSAEREWDGVVQVSGSTGCAGGSCFNPQNAPVNESFDVQLCYYLQAPLGVQFDDAGVAAGYLAVAQQTCVDKRFAIQDGLVEIGPSKGSACSTSAQCNQSQGELCFSGACTAGCPANDFPVLGSGWGLLVSGPDTDRGFFTQSPRGSGTQYTGSGAITSVVYAGTSLQVALASGAQNAQVTIQLPPGVAPTLSVGTAVAVTLVTGSVDSPDGPIPAGAIVLRGLGTGALLFAADMVQGAPLLTAAEVTPFSLGSDTTPLGCTQGLCGKLLYYARTYDAGVAAGSVVPGAQATVVTSAGTYTLVNVNDSAYASTSCSVSELRPWVLWRTGP
jgi:hypothetical protein